MGYHVRSYPHVVGLYNGHRKVVTVSRKRAMKVGHVAVKAFLVSNGIPAYYIDDILYCLF